MGRILITFLITILLGVSDLRSFGQPNSIPYNTVLSKLKIYSEIHSIEKSYLHFDKPYYATGDTIYFKAYVTAGERHQLSAISGILHVELINSENKIDKSIKLQLINGVGWGDFALPDSLSAGNYRIRAYTQWMRNDSNYFEQIVPVGSVHNQKVPESADRLTTVSVKPDLQFMPEGGRLVTGIESKVAFKAVGANGLGMDVKGVVTDNSGKEVCSFTSTHLGMGYFELKPELGKTYKAQLTYKNGLQDIADLPKIENSGVVLSVNNDSLPKASVRIEVNKEYFDLNKGKDYTLLIYSGGVATSVKINLDSMVTTITLLKRHLYTGIARITLFSGLDEPLCERLIFVQNYDWLNLVVTSDKENYSAREKASIKLNAKTRSDSAAMGHFSVAVIDESKVPVNENEETTILSNLLLTSDLKGTIEKPNYYFNNIAPEKLKQLDLVMLTHGYRHFEWRQVLNNNPAPPIWKAETSLQINGIAKSLFNKPLPEAAVALISFEPKSLTNTVANDKGEFSFDHLLFTDSIRFVLQAVNAKGGNKTKLAYKQDGHKPAIHTLSTPLIGSSIPGTYLENNEKQQEELNRLGLGKGRALKEVKIKAKKSIPKANPRYGIPDQVVSGDKILYGGMLSVRLAGLIHFNRHFKNKPVLVVWNGVEMPSDFNIDDINTGSIESIEVFTDAIGPDYDNVLSINTTFGLQPKDMIATGILPITIQGYYKAREFYSPKYQSSSTSTLPDLRSTIYWQPELTTDKNGDATFNYYNADGKGNYRVVVEGIDDKGNIGRQVFRYQVN